MTSEILSIYCDKPRNAVQAVQFNDHCTWTSVYRDSAVGKETRHWVEGLGVQFRWMRRFQHLSRTALRPTHSLVNLYCVPFQGVKRPERGVNHPPHLAVTLKTEYSYTSPTPCAFMAHSTVTFTFTSTSYISISIPLFLTLSLIQSIPHSASFRSVHCLSFSLTVRSEFSQA